MNESNSILITKAKLEATSFVNHLISDYELQTVTIEGILNGILADLRSQEIRELSIKLLLSMESKEESQSE